VTGVTSGLRELLGKLVCHRVDFEHERYEGNDHSPAPLSSADVVSSVVADSGRREDFDFLAEDLHIVVVDIDHPAHLVESTTPGHHHLYVEIPPVSTEAYFRWLEASAEIGLIEPGYVSAFKARGFTCVRLPWVQKPGVVPAPKPLPSAEIPVEDLRF
jgi:hypothetical protein